MMCRLAAICLTLAVCVLSGCNRGSDGPSFISTDITGAAFGKDFQLTDHNGKPRRLADFEGKVVVVFFGSTQCPDFCPTTMADYAGVLKQLGADAQRVQVLFITVDPERDTPALL